SLNVASKEPGSFEKGIEVVPNSSAMSGGSMPESQEKPSPAPSERQVMNVCLESDSLQIRGRVFHGGSEVPLAGLQVQAMCRQTTDKKDGEAVGSDFSYADGRFQIDLDRDGIAGLPVFLCGSKDATLAGRVTDGDGTALADFDIRIVSAPTSPIEIAL